MHAMKNARLSFGHYLFLPKFKGKVCFKKIKITVGRNIERLFTHNKCIFEVYCMKNVCRPLPQISAQLSPHQECLPLSID